MTNDYFLHKIAHYEYPTQLCTAIEGSLDVRLCNYFRIKRICECYIVGLMGGGRLAGSFCLALQNI